MKNDPRMSRPYIMVGHKSDKGFNTEIVAPKSKAGKGCLGIGMFKAGVNARRINKETMRVKLAKASFIPVARLVANGEVIARKHC